MNIEEFQSKDEMSQIVHVLSGVKDFIDKLLTKEEHQHHKIKLMSDLQRNMEYISLITGAGDVAPTAIKRLPQATTIAGQPIRFTGKKRDFDVTPEETAVNSLKDRVDMIYPSFLTMDSKDIRKNVDDSVIRGVAKKAKMFGISKDSPAEIDIAFIDKVKGKIIENEQFKQEQEESKVEQEIASAFDDQPKATSNDAPDSVEEIEKLKDEMETTATMPKPGQPLAPGDDKVDLSIKPETLQAKPAKKK